jgi:hypothetical protein
MLQWQVYLLLVLGAIIGTKIFVSKRPEQDFKYKKLIVGAFMGMGFWTAWERIQIASATFGYGWVLSLMLILFTLYGAWGWMRWENKG